MYEALVAWYKFTFTVYREGHSKSLWWKDFILQMKAIDEALEKAEEQVARYTEAAKETKVLQFGL